MRYTKTLPENPGFILQNTYFTHLRTSKDSHTIDL